MSACVVMRGGVGDGIDYKIMLFDEFGRKRVLHEPIIIDARVYF